MTTAIIVLVLLLVFDQWVSLLRINRADREIEALQTRSDWLEQVVGCHRKELDALATVVAANADRTTRLEGEDAPRRPACPQTYIMTTYPKRADEL